MLAGVAYVAVLLTACTQHGNSWVQVLWLMNGCIVLYAALILALHTRRTRAMATGFVLFSVAYAGAVRWSPEVLPTQFVGPWIGENPSASDRVERLAWEVSASQHASSSEYRQRVRREYQRALDEVDAYQRYKRVERALNAAIMLAAGLIGAAAGAHVWKTVQNDMPPNPDAHRS